MYCTWHCGKRKTKGKYTSQPGTEFISIHINIRIYTYSVKYKVGTIWYMHVWVCNLYYISYLCLIDVCCNK